MSRLYESIKQGLTEAIEYERGNLLNTKVDKITVSPVYVYSANEIKNIRLQQGMTQKVFAAALGVSVKTVEAWESGTNTPSGIANRMLDLIKHDNGLFERCAIVARS